MSTETVVLRAMAVVVLLCASFSPGPAQPSQSGAEAEQLFRNGKALMLAGDYAKACEAFAGSMRKQPVPATIVNLADCLEKNQQYASAWGAFLEGARLARSRPDLDGLRQVAEDRAKALERRLSHLIIAVASDARIAGLVITRNEGQLDPEVWSVEMPVDGGRYVITAKAPGFEPWSTTIDVGAAQDRQSVTIPPLTAAKQPEVAGEVRSTSRGSLTGSRKAAIALWSTGLLGLGAGLALEIKSGHTYDDAQVGATREDRHTLTDRANRERQFAALAAGLGASAVSVGVYLWITSKPGRSERLALRPHVDEHGFAASLIGHF